MGNKLGFAVLAGLLMLGGCATGKKANLEGQGLKERISMLESQVQDKDQEINYLKEELSKIQQARENVPSEEVKSRPNAKQIQIALRNAGYDPGKIDGRLGKKSREAIKAFQKDNKLKADGRVGKETWMLLKEYLTKKSK